MFRKAGPSNRKTVRSPVKDICTCWNDKNLAGVEGKILNCMKIEWRAGFKRVSKTALGEGGDRHPVRRVGEGSRLKLLGDVWGLPQRKISFTVRCSGFWELGLTVP